MKNFLRNAGVAFLGLLCVLSCTTERFDDPNQQGFSSEHEELINQAKEWFTTYRGNANIDKINYRVGAVDWSKVRIKLHSKKGYYGIFAPINKVGLKQNTRRNIAIHIKEDGINGFIMEYTRTSAPDAAVKEGVSKIYNKRGIWLKAVTYAGGKRIKTKYRKDISPLNTARKFDEGFDGGELDPVCVGDCGDEWPEEEEEEEWPEEPWSPVDECDDFICDYDDYEEEEEPACKGCDDDTPPPPSCESFQFTRPFHSSPFQNAYVSEIRMKAYTNNNSIPVDLSYPTPMEFNAPVRDRFNNFYTNGILAEASARALKYAMDQTWERFKDDPTANETSARIFFENVLKEDYPLRIPGGRVTIRPTKIDGPIIPYQTGTFGTGSCD